MICEAACGEHDTGDHGSEGGDQLINEAEQRAHQAGDVLAGTINFVVGAVSGHGDDDVAGQTLEASGRNGQDNIEDQEVAPVQSTGLRVGGHGGGVTQQPQSDQSAVADQSADGADDHALALAKLGCEIRNAAEGDDAAGDGGQSGNVALQQGRTGDAGEHCDLNGAGLCRAAQLIGRCGQDQHLDSAVILQSIPVILQTDLDRLTSTKELRTVLRSDGDDSQNGEDRRSDGGEHPEGVEELSGSIAADILVACCNAGADDRDTGEQQGVIHTVEGCEQRTLLGVVGHAGLSRLGNDALAGVTQIVDHQDHNVEGEAGCLRQQMGAMEQNETGHAQGDVADDDERAVLAELAVGLIDHEADERVGDTVPDAHDHAQGRGHHHADADPAHQVVGSVTHHHHVQVGSRVVQCKACDAPQRNAVDAVVLVVFVVVLIRQTSRFCHCFLSLICV